MVHSEMNVTITKIAGSNIMIHGLIYEFACSAANRTGTLIFFDPNWWPDWRFGHTCTLLNRFEVIRTKYLATGSTRLNSQIINQQEQNEYFSCVSRMWLPGSRWSIEPNKHSFLHYEFTTLAPSCQNTQATCYDLLCIPFCYIIGNSDVKFKSNQIHRQLLYCLTCTCRLTCLFSSEVASKWHSWGIHLLILTCQVSNLCMLLSHGQVSFVSPVGLANHFHLLDAQDNSVF